MAAETTWDPLIGRLMGSYRLEKLIGEGGMGRIYLARHARIGRKAAVKVLSAEAARDSHAVSRFFHEAKAAGEASHENLVEVYDFIRDKDTGCCAYIMEFLEGEDLRQVLMRERRIKPERAMHIGAQLAAGLGAAHAMGVVHRDVKPENVYLIERAGIPDFVKLLDFGVAKFATAVAHKTQAGFAVGSPYYMAPEQTLAKDIDGRADLYAIGIIMYEMLAGRVPFDGAKNSEIYRKHCEDPLPPLRPDYGMGTIPPALMGVIKRALAKKADERYQTASELRAAILSSSDETLGEEEEEDSEEPTKTQKVKAPRDTVIGTGPVSGRRR